MSGVDYFDPLPVNMDEAVEFDDDPIPAGDYELELVGAEGGTSQAGNPKVTWEFTVVGGSEFDGKRIWHDTVTVGRGAGMFRAVISAFGYDFDEWLAANGGSVTPEALNALLGETTDARVKIDTPDEETLERYPNARPRNRVARFL